MILSKKRIIKALIRLVCAYVVRKPPKTGFLALRPISASFTAYTYMHFRFKILNSILYVYLYTFLGTYQRFSDNYKSHELGQNNNFNLAH